MNEGGTVLIVDEKVSGHFTTDGDEVEQMMYGWSVFHCLLVGMADRPSAATGTVMRSKTLKQPAFEAGFEEVELLGIDNYFFRF